MVWLGDTFMAEDVAQPMEGIEEADAQVANPDNDRDGRVFATPPRSVAPRGVPDAPPRSHARRQLHF